MASPFREDVLAMNARYHLDTWLNGLPEVSEPEEVKGSCDCKPDRCVFWRPTSFNTETPRSVEILWGGMFRKECAERFLQQRWLCTDLLPGMWA